MARRSGLGKGLGALIPNRGAGQPTSALREVPIANIRPNTHQPRSYFDEEAMSSLAASIRELGVLQPILVRELAGKADAYELIAGERRWRAARRAGLQTIPVLAQSVTAGDGRASSRRWSRTSTGRTSTLSRRRPPTSSSSTTSASPTSRWPSGSGKQPGGRRPTRSGSCSSRPASSGPWPMPRSRPGHARALLGTPDRALQEALVTRIIAEGLTVRASRTTVRELAEQGSRSAARGRYYHWYDQEGGAPGACRSRGCSSWRSCWRSFLNTRVKVDLRNRRGPPDRRVRHARGPRAHLPDDGRGRAGDAQSLPG